MKKESVTTTTTYSVAIPKQCRLHNRWLHSVHYNENQAEDAAKQAASVYGKAMIVKQTIVTTVEIGKIYKKGDK